MLVSFLIFGKKDNAANFRSIGKLSTRPSGWDLMMIRRYMEPTPWTLKHFCRLYICKLCSSRWSSLYKFCRHCRESRFFFFLHANPWIPGGGTSIFMVVIHRRRSPLHHFGHARTIHEHVVTIQITHVTPQIDCGDVTMLSQKDRPWRQWLTRKAILAMIFIRDFITRDNHCQMASFVTKCRYSR